MMLGRGNDIHHLQIARTPNLRLKLIRSKEIVQGYILDREFVLRVYT